MPRYAAIDIGSNSVRMEAAEVLAGGVTRVLAADREVTRLGSSVFSGGRISDEAMALVCSVLSRMALAYQRLDVIAVRAVATSAVRDASNQAEFIAKASIALGSPVEIISGPEEARLIHLGVQARWPHPKQRVMMIDVGGGSAEIILAGNGRMLEGFSRPLGAVRLTEVFLKSDPPSELELHRLESFIDEKIDAAVQRIGLEKVDRVIATSATAAAIVSAANRVPRTNRDAADRLRATTPQIRQLYRQFCQGSLAVRKKIVGVGPRRAEILVAGTAVFLRILEAFHARGMHYSVAGVRDGIIADLSARGVGGERSRLSRDQVRMVESMSRKFGIAVKHGRKVAALGNDLFDALQPLHGLPLESGRLLQAASYLHDVGHFISDTGHHKHSAYVVTNSDMPGFTDRERLLIGLLCRYHRKSMPSPRHDQFQNLPPDAKRTLLLLAPLLRLADGLDSGQEQHIERIDCSIRDAEVALCIYGTGDIDLEVWAAERAAEIFRQVYNMPLSVMKGRNL